MDVAALLGKHQHPKGVGVTIEAEHLCTTLRGVRATGARTLTATLRGLPRRDGQSRHEFLSLAHGGGSV